MLTFADSTVNLASKSNINKIICSIDMRFWCDINPVIDWSPAE